MPTSSRRVWIAGHRGMVGSAITRRLQARGETLLEVSRSELDLRDQGAVIGWLQRNLALETNVIHGAHLAGVERLVLLGSSCIYPRFARQPIKEEYLLTGELEPTNEWYAIAKIAGIKLCQAYRKQHGRRYISVMPCNLYGPHDNFDLNSSHVLPALMRKFHEATVAKHGTVTVWGSGAPLREFLHVDDLAAGVVHCLEVYDEAQHINCGSGREISIADLARRVAEVVGFQGEIVFDRSKPDGMARKLMDSSRMAALGWTPAISLDEGIRATYRWFLEHEAPRLAA
jgi:GDP-L-fucose synthase